MRRTFLLTAALFALFVSPTAFGEDLIGSDVNEAICAECRKTDNKNSLSCFRCHYCETESFTVKWRPGLADHYQSLSLKEADAAILSVEAEQIKASLALAAFGPSLPMRQPSANGVALQKFDLTKAQLRGSYEQKVTLDYAKVDFSKFSANDPLALENLKITVYLCLDSNRDGRCSDEDRRYQVIPQTSSMPVCNVPQVVPLGAK